MANDSKSDHWDINEHNDANSKPPPAKKTKMKECEKKSSHTNKDVLGILNQVESNRAKEETAKL